jgi:phosphatidylinositol alpha-1,6-mannosyltransferase
MKPRRRKLLTIGHSYVVPLNRRLPEAIAATGEWDVTVAAPARFRGDFAWHAAQPAPGDRCTLLAVPVHFSRRIHVMLYGSALTRAIRDTEWDLVHVWEEPYVAAAAQVAAATPPDVPLVFATFQNIDKRYPPPFNWIERYALGRADGVVAFGSTAAAMLAHRGFAAERTRMIPPGVDSTRFAPDPVARADVRTRLGWNDDVPVVGFLGRLIVDKGLRTMTAALDRVSAPWRALIVGAGPLERELRAWGDRYQGRVAFQNTVAHDEVPQWLNAMNVLCAPSQTTLSWREQFGRMLIEAFACGVPVVASDSGEIPFVVGDAGRIVPEGDVDAWSQALADVLGNPALRADMARRGHDRVRDTFAWPVVARAHAAFFDDVIARRTVAC